MLMYSVARSTAGVKAAGTGCWSLQLPLSALSALVFTVLIKKKVIDLEQQEASVFVLCADS